MPEKQLTSQQTESLKRLYFQLTEPIIEGLQKISRCEKKVIGNKKPQSVNDLVGHIKNMTPFGIKHVEMFLGGVLRHSTLPMLGEKKKKN
jgi:hypothetical protein